MVPFYVVLGSVLAISILSGGAAIALAIIAVGDTTAGSILVSKGLAERKDYHDTRNWCHQL